VAASSLSTPLSIHFTYIPEQIMELASRLQTPDLLLLGSGSTSYCVPHAAKTILKYLYAKCVESRHAECNSRASIWCILRCYTLVKSSLLARYSSSVCLIFQDHRRVLSGAIAEGLQLSSSYHILDRSVGHLLACDIANSSSRLMLTNMISNCHELMVCRRAHCNWLHS
jgi:hypothetical protein